MDLNCISDQHTLPPILASCPTCSFSYCHRFQGVVPASPRLLPPIPMFLQQLPKKKKGFLAPASSPPRSFSTSNCVSLVNVGLPTLGSDPRGSLLGPSGECPPPLALPAPSLARASYRSADRTCVALPACVPSSSLAYHLMCYPCVCCLAAAVRVLAGHPSG